MLKRQSMINKKVKRFCWFELEQDRGIDSSVEFIRPLMFACH